MQVHNAPKEDSQLKDKGPYQATRQLHMHSSTHLFRRPQDLSLVKCDSNYVIMHHRRRNGYRMSYRNLVAANPAGAHTMETPAAHIKRSQCMQHSPPESWSSRSRSQQQPMEEELQHPCTNNSKQLQHSSSRSLQNHVHSRTGKCLTLFCRIT